MFSSDVDVFDGKVRILCCLQRHGAGSLVELFPPAVLPRELWPGEGRSRGVLPARTTENIHRLGCSVVDSNPELFPGAGVIVPDPAKNKRADKSKFIYNFRPVNSGLFTIGLTLSVAQ